MVQIFQEPDNQRNLIFDDLAMNLPQMISDFQKQRQENQSLTDLAEQIGIFNLDDQESSELSSKKDLTGYRIYKNTFNTLPAETKLNLINENIEKKKSLQNEEILKKRLRAYERASKMPEGFFEGMSDEGAQKMTLEFIKSGNNGMSSALNLNEELNQQKSRTSSRIQDILAPYGVIDNLTKMIMFRGDVGEEKRKEIQNQILEERTRSMSVMKDLYKRFGQDVPKDLQEQYLDIVQFPERLDEKKSSDTKEASLSKSKEEKIQKAYEILKGKMKK